MGRSLTITVTLLGAILGFGCNAPRVTSVGSIEPDANQSLPTNATDPRSASAPSFTEDSGFPSEPDSSAGRAGRFEEAAPVAQLPVEPPVEPKTTPLQQAEALLAGGELEEALEAFAEILLNNPGQIEAYVGLANRPVRNRPR